MRGTFRGLVVVGLVMSAASTAAAQASAEANIRRLISQQLTEVGFFGPVASAAIESATHLSAPSGPPGALNIVAAPTIGDKSKPWTLRSDIGTITAFTRQGDTIVVLSGKRPIDLGAGVVLPSDAFVVQDFACIASRRGGTLGTSDFPADLKDRLAGFWPNGTITVLERGVAVRAEPAGDLLDDLRHFLALDKVDAKTVVAFERNRSAMSTKLFAFGKVSKPFGIEMTLFNPMLSFTKKAGDPKPTIGIGADTATVYAHSYEFKAEGSKLTAPDIFLLETDRLAPSDLVDLAQAFSAPLFKLAPGTRPPWKFSVIPTFSLHSPSRNSIPPNFRMPDSSKVVVFAAIKSNTDWNIKGPGLNVRGALSVDLMPRKQDIAFAEVGMDKSSMSVGFGLLDFSLPESDLHFGTATATIAASTGNASMGIAAASGSDCFKQKFAFSVDATGWPRADVNGNQALKALSPAGFVGNFKACANEGVALVTWVLKVGEQVIGFVADEMIKASSAVLGAKNTAYAAKAVGYPVTLVGSAIGKVLNKDDLLNLAQEVYGNDQVAAIGRAAGYGARDVYDWTYMKGIDAGSAGAMMAKAFFKDDVLQGAKTVYFNLDNKGLAEVGRAAGYTATEVKDWFAVKAGLGDKEILRALRAGGYAKDEVKNVAMTAFKWSSSKFEDAWGSFADTVGGWFRF